MSTTTIVLSSVLTLAAATLYYKIINSLQPISKLRGKNVIITGASWGIGAQLTHHCAQHSAANIVIAARRTNLLQEVAEKSKQLSLKSGNSECNIKTVTCDLGQEKECERLIAEAVEFFKEKSKANDASKPLIDLLILNHTATVYDHMDFTSPESTISILRDLTNVNLLGFASLAHFAIPYMYTTNKSAADSKTHIVSISSVLAEMSLGMAYGYSTTKAAINSYFNCLRDEILHANLPVTVTTVHLGAIDTERLRLHIDKYKIGGILGLVNLNWFSVSAEGASEHILRSSLSGLEDFWYPRSSVIVRLVYGFIPETGRRIGRLAQSLLQ